jgi:hypothetical protein
MLHIETWLKMVEDGPDCCRSVRRVHTGRRICSGRLALVQFVLAKARRKPALSSAAREEGPSLRYTAVNNVQKITRLF